MLHLALVCPEVPGHLNPMTTLGRELQRRGHRVTLVARPDARRKAESAGLNFVPVGGEQFPEGSEKAAAAALGRLRGLKAMRFTVELLRQGAEVLLKEGPEVARREKFDGMVVDQISAAGGTVADHAGLPHVTVCNALPLTPDLDDVPSTMKSWPFRRGPLAWARDGFGWVLLRWIGHPLIKVIADHRRAQGLAPLKDVFGGGSALAEIAQQPQFFDFPRPGQPENFHYTGPWHRESSPEEVPFPWEKLDGRPLIYASMGTLQNGLEHIFAAIAEACVGLDGQLVIALGNRHQDAAAVAAKLPGAPLVVAFAPQLALLDKAAMIITHAGQNTALEALSRGLPMVAIPVANDQFGVASRLEWLGVAEVVQLAKLNAARLRTMVMKVLHDPAYRRKAQSCCEKLRGINGAGLAADLVEKAIRSRLPVLRGQ